MQMMLKYWFSLFYISFIKKLNLFVLQIIGRGIFWL